MRAVRWLMEDLVRGVCALFFAVLVAVVFAQVVARYVFGSGLAWSEELARYLTIWLTFLGGAAALGSKAHMAITMVVDRLPPRTRYGAEWVSTLAVTGFVAVVVVAGGSLALAAMPNRSPALDLPLGLIYLALPVSGVVMLYHLGHDLVALARGRGGRAR